MDCKDPQYIEAIKTLSCKTSASAYGIFDPSGKLLSMKERPNICGVPYCKKCEKERQGRLMQKYKPYFDVHEKPYIRHVIATTRVFTREEFPTLIKQFTQNIKDFHENLRKTYGYPLRAIALVEPHYQKETDSYNLHVHYGIFSHIDIRKFRSFWCKAHHDQDLLVKFPQRRGRPVFRTSKGAFLEYFTRRRVQQARTMPLRDYYDHVRRMQLIRRVGFTKAYLAVVTTLRKEQQNEEKFGEENQLIWLGNYDYRIQFTRIEAEFRRRYEMAPDYDEEIISLRAHVRRIFRELTDDVTIIVEQRSLNSYLDKNEEYDNKLLCINSGSRVSCR